MAHLNVQAHRIEAKIAYVGTEAVATTFARLKDEAGFSRTSEFALEWRPKRRFRDCEVLVRVVGEDTADADGVVASGDIGALEKALEEVLSKLETSAPETKRANGEATHPLLDALRQVLRDTVREHVDELAAKLIESKRGDDAGFLHVVQALEETDGQLRQLRDAISSTAHAVDAVTLRAQRFDLWMKRIEKLDESTATINTKLAELIDELKKPRRGWFT